MKTHAWRTPAALVVAALALGSCTTPSSFSGSGHDMGSTPNPGMSATAPAGPATGTRASGPHNTADVTFATMMIAHHQQAIEMADLILAKDGPDEKVTALANRIKAAQVPEIARMSGWLAGWGQNPNPNSTGTMTGMNGTNGMNGDGMMSQVDMTALQAATGQAATQLFLTGMITHHEGAVAMAQTELSGGSNPDSTALAQSIITSQTAEISEMNALLGR